MLCCSLLFVRTRVNLHAGYRPSVARAECNVCTLDLTTERLIPQYRVISMGRLKSAWERPWWLRATPNYIDECTKMNPRFLWKISQVNEPTISEFMATFSAWIRVPGHRVLRCGSLQIKSEQNCRIFVHLVLVLGPRIRRESRVLAPQWG